MSRSLSKIALVSAAIGVMAMGSAYATPSLTVVSGADDLTIAGSGNTVIYNNANFNGWDIQLVFGDSNSPKVSPFGLDITSLSVTCSGGPCASKPLTLWLSDTGFTSSVGLNGFHTTLSDTQSGTGSVTHTAYDSPSNLLFGTGATIGSVTCNGSCAGSATGGGPAGPGAYSLTLEDVLTASGGALSYSIDGNVTAPEPATIALFGAALLGCALFLGRRRLPQR